MKKHISANTIKSIKANIFSGAYEAISDWNAFPWHCSGGRIDTNQKNSSQALSIDVFGTLICMDRKSRDAVMNAIVSEMGMAPDLDWQLQLEWNDASNSLKERRTKTHVDVMAQAEKTLLFLECKFTESGGGACSQTRPRGGLHKGATHCTGSYKEQENPIDGRRARCALTAKGIRYWDVIPQVFDFDSESQYEPCPFRDGCYQWMRNVVLCTALAKQRQAGVAVVYAESPHLEFPSKGKGDFETKFVPHLKRDKIKVKAVSYQQVLDCGRAAIEDNSEPLRIWQRLTSHVMTKVHEVATTSSRRPTRN